MTTLVWFRQDLRIADNPALDAALKCGAPVIPVYVLTQGARFDPQGAYVRRWIPELARLPDEYIHQPWTAPPAVLEAAGVMLGENYPERLVDHDIARHEALRAHSAVKG